MEGVLCQSDICVLSIFFIIMSKMFFSAYYYDGVDDRDRALDKSEGVTLWRWCKTTETSSHEELESETSSNTKSDSYIFKAIICGASSTDMWRSTSCILLLLNRKHMTNARRIRYAKSRKFPLQEKMKRSRLFEKKRRTTNSDFHRHRKNHTTNSHDWSLSFKTRLSVIYDPTSNSSNEDRLISMIGLPLRNARYSSYRTKQV